MERKIIEYKFVCEEMEVTMAEEKLHQGIEIQHVTKRFVTKRDSVTALDDVSLHVRSEEFMALLGTSGCGKSTLLRIIGGLENATEGKILFKQKEIVEPGAERGMVFQTYTLFPWLTVGENIGYGLKEKKVPKKEREEIVGQYVDLVGLRGFENLYPKNLSGGMKQRVAIARALANNPDILLMDEPFGALDMQTRGVMQELVLNIWQKSPKTIVMVTHDIDEAILLADRIAIMTARPGKIKEIIDVKLPRPRNFKTKNSREFIEYREKIQDMIREESSKLIGSGIM